MTEKSDTQVQDGFDLIEYPCDFAFKAMCGVVADAPESCEQVIRAIVLDLLPASAILASRVTPSRTGKFEAVTLTVQLQNRQQLEQIYQAVAASERVVMTL